MKPKTYLIKYRAFDYDGCCITSGTMRVKNKFTEPHAKVALEIFLKKKNKDMGRMVADSCEEETRNPVVRHLSDISDIFNEIFGNKIKPC